MTKEWEYYNHALIPTTAPHVTPDVSWMKDSKKWRAYADGKHPLFSRWTTDFDCKEDLGWWYCIKDDQLDLSKVKSKIRYTINHGLKNVDVRLIIPSEYSVELTEVNIAARLGYGEEIDIEEEKEQLIEQFRCYKKDNIEFIGAFLRESGKLIGYGIYEIYSDWVSQSVIKTNPDYLRTDVNAALVYFAVNRYMDGVFAVKYISNGAKNISHDTNFHNYLIKYFGFRKAYCKLHIQYQPIVGIVVNILFPFRKFLYKFEKNPMVHNVVSILKMEEIHRISKAGK